jgi:hypothetical protein
VRVARVAARPLPPTAVAGNYYVYILASLSRTTCVAVTNALAHRGDEPGVGEPRGGDVPREGTLTTGWIAARGESPARRGRFLGRAQALVYGRVPSCAPSE